MKASIRVPSSRGIRSPSARKKRPASLPRVWGELAGNVVRQDLGSVVSGALSSEPQAHDLATHSPPIEYDHCRVDWGRSAREVHDLVRGLSPKPSAFTTVSGKKLKLVRVSIASAPFLLGPGVVGVDAGRAWVGTGAGSIELLTAQLEGKRELPARDLVNGRTLAAGLVLGG
jgi:methionyl-tRNA formyltransferase